MTRVTSAAPNWIRPLALLKNCILDQPRDDSLVAAGERPCLAGAFCHQRKAFGGHLDVRTRGGEQFAVRRDDHPLRDLYQLLDCRGREDEYTGQSVDEFGNHPEVDESIVKELLLS